MPYIGVEEETETEITYRISIDTTIIVARETNDVNETSEIVAEGYDEVRTKKDYFFKYKEYERVKSEVREKSPFIIVSEGGKFGINDTLNNIFIEPSFTERPRILNSIKWICVRKNGQYGIIDFSGNWVFPLEARKVALAFNPGNQKYMFELKEKGYRFLFNNNLELVLEQPVLYFQNEYFDWAAVSDSIRPIMSEIIRPKLYQQYYVLSDDEYGHVFTADGKYISSHKGTYDYNVSFEGLPRQNKYHSEFVPVGKFVEKGKEYYVRLSDGFEYKRN